MAGVDHAYQYSVEVKSRFSLFLDDPLGNEDPDLLQNRIQNQRQVKKKKDKPISAVDVSTLGDSVSENEIKTDETNNKSKTVAGAKQAKSPHVSPSSIPNEPASEVSVKSQADHNDVPAPRGRGMPRGFGRGMRGRGQGPRQFSEGPPPSGDLHAQSREVHFEPRGRGGRGRGGFSRGRGAGFTDVREFERLMGSDRMTPRSGHLKEDQFAEQPIDGEDPHNVPVPESGDVDRSEIEEAEKCEDVVNGEVEPTEEEQKSYTLEEYKAMRSSAKPTIALASKGTRKPNDGKDVFANMVPHRKINETSDEEVEEVEKEPEEEPIFEINVSFTDRFSERGRGSFGARGAFGRGAPGFRGTGGRPRGGRGTRAGFRGASRGRGFSRGVGFEHQAAPPPIYSDQDFPSLK